MIIKDKIFQFLENFVPIFCIIILIIVLFFSSLNTIFCLFLFLDGNNENQILINELEEQLYYSQYDKEKAIDELENLENEFQQKQLEYESIISIYEEKLSSNIKDSLEYMGEFTLTAYCCERYDHICGFGDGLTALGTTLRPGIVAVDKSVIPLGSIVVINGESYLAADTGGSISGNHIDIAVETHSSAIDFGVRSGEVWIIK